MRLVKVNYGLWRVSITGADGTEIFVGSDWGAPLNAVKDAVKQVYRFDLQPENFTSFDNWTFLAAHLGTDEANRIFTETTPF